MTPISRRKMILTGAAGLGLAACTNATGTGANQRLEARVDAARSYLLSTYPQLADLEQSASGVLWMPLMTEASLGIGGAYGQGALRIGGKTADYYSASQASFGFQIGAQQYAHALFFNTPDALAMFRAADGWVAGADARFALPTQGGTIGADTLSSTLPIQPVIFGQSGLIAGASIVGTKYTRIIPSYF